VLISSTWILIRDDLRIPVTVVGTLPWPPRDKVTNNLVADGPNAEHLITTLRSFPKAPKYDGGPCVGMFNIRYADGSEGDLWIYHTMKHAHLRVTINRESYEVPSKSFHALLREAFPQTSFDEVHWLKPE
jgi:hypothetical protein